MRIWEWRGCRAVSCWGRKTLPAKSPGTNGKSSSSPGTGDGEDDKELAGPLPHGRSESCLGSLFPSTRPALVCKSTLPRRNAGGCATRHKALHFHHVTICTISEELPADIPPLPQDDRRVPPEKHRSTAAILKPQHKQRVRPLSFPREPLPAREE